MNLIMYFVELLKKEGFNEEKAFHLIGLLKNIFINESTAEILISNKQIKESNSFLNQMKEKIEEVKDKIENSEDKKIHKFDDYLKEPNNPE